MKKYSFIISFLLIIIIVKGQNQSIEIQSPMPASPNAVSLGKYGEVPVSLSTGIPNISIPLYKINSGKITVPITLSYHSSGLKVEELASWVGLGWALNAGGVITRACNGLPDEGLRGFMYEGNKVIQFPDMANIPETKTSEQYQYMLSVDNNEIDTEPDIFYYQFGNYSGKFFLNNNGIIISMPENNLKITYLTTLNDGWEIITPDGTKYTFDVGEKTTSSLVGSQGAQSSMTSAWYLRKIIDTYTNEINIQYVDETYGFEVLGSKIAGILPPQGTVYAPYTEVLYPRYYNEIEGKRLSKIIFQNGELDFVVSDQGRLDVSNAILGKIQVRNQHSLIKEFVLNTSYFTTASSPIDAYTKKLRLDAVIELSPNNIQGAKHSFEYNSSILPHRLSFAQDHWGYYNGADANTTLVCFSDRPYETYDPEISIGANRNPNPDYVQGGMLRKIIYPTGGTTTFEYESNTVIGGIPEHYEDGLAVFTVSGNNVGTTDDEVLFEHSFVITSADLNGQMTGKFRLSVNEDQIPSNITYALRDDINGGFVFYTSNSNNQINHTLYNIGTGSYTLQVYISSTHPNSPPYESFSASLIKQQLVPLQYFNKTAPGVRIKKIINTALEGGIQEIKNFKYNKFSQSFSSGVLGSDPKYARIGLGMDPGGYLQSYLLISSFSAYPLTNSQGTFVVYENVTTEFGENAVGGKTESTFLTNYSDIICTTLLPFPWINFPFPPITKYEWRRGLLVLETKYRKSNLGFEKNSEHEYEYQFTKDLPGSPASIEVTGIKHMRMVPKEYILNLQAWGHPYFWGFLWLHYPIVTEFAYLKQEKVRSYNSIEPNSYVENTIKYAYDYDYFLPTIITTTTSKNEQLITINKYAFDLQSTSSPNVYNEMLNRHILDPIIEQKIYADINIPPVINSSSFIQSVKTNYNFWYNNNWGSQSNNSLIVPQTIETKRLLNIPEVQLRYHAYDAYGNLTQTSKEGDINKSYIWDFGNLLVAEVTNASINEIAYTSFESNNHNNWTGIVPANIKSGAGATGTKFYEQPAFTLQKAGLNAFDKYWVTYWSKNGPCSVYGTQNGYPKQLETTTVGTEIWKFYQHLVSGQSLVSVVGSGAIDELRLYPQNSFMNTYTHTPLIGITSKCDQANAIEYYEYDSLGRLMIRKDSRGNILKKIEYKYY